MAWYTRLAYNNIVPIPFFRVIIKELEEEEAEKQQIKMLERPESKSSNARSPKPIISPLYVETMQYAYFQGLVSEAAFCETLKISQTEIEKYLC